MTATSRVSVASRAHRTLRSVDRFHFGSAVGTNNDKEHGDVIGVYENPEGVEPRRIVLTEAGIGCLGSAEPRWILFDDIETTIAPQDKLIGDSIRVVLKSGLQTELRIAGGDDRFKDVFSFVRFIDRVLEDRRSPR